MDSAYTGKLSAGPRKEKIDAFLLPLYQEIEPAYQDLMAAYKLAFAAYKILAAGYNGKLA